MREHIYFLDISVGTKGLLSLGGKMWEEPRTGD